MPREETGYVKLSSSSMVSAFRRLGALLSEVLFATERDEEKRVAWCERLRS